MIDGSGRKAHAILSSHLKSGRRAHKAMRLAAIELFC